MAELALDVQATPSLGTVTLTGDLDGRAGDELLVAYDSATAEGAMTVRLDFAKAEYINSTGIALVVGLLAAARRDGRVVEVCGLSDHYRHIFEITRLADLVTFVSAPGGNGQVAS